MANYSQLKAAIADAIKTNGTQAITGQVLQNVLNSIVSVIGANYTFAGVATPSTNPGTPDQNVVYLASQAGTYTNFGGIKLSAGISVLKWNGAWSSSTVEDVDLYTEADVLNDFSIGDEDGNDIVKFRGGEIITKKYDSGKSVQSEFSIYDYSVTDKDGNDIMAIESGHIKTKFFESRKIVGKPYKRKVLYHYDVDCSMPYVPYDGNTDSFSDISVNTPVDPTKIYQDRAALYLPLSYKSQGTPTRLVIIGRHGNNIFTDTDDYVDKDIDPTSVTGYVHVCPYLLSLGYALLAIDGTPDGWANEMMEGTKPESRLFDGSTNGNYVSVRSARKAYELAVKDYNLCRDGVFGFGFSQGGWQVMNIAELSGIPFIAVAMKSPVVNLDRYFGDAGGTVISEGGIEYPGWKYLMIRQYYGINPALNEMSLDDFNAIPEEKWRWVGFSPLQRFAVNVPTDEEISAIDENLPLQPQLEAFDIVRQCQFPTKIWIAKNDEQVGYKQQAVLCQGIRNAGMYADFKLYSTGGHSLNVSSFINNMVGTFTYNGNTYSLCPPAYEIALFFADNGGNNIITEDINN